MPRGRVGYTAAVQDESMEMIPPLPTSSSTTSGMSRAVRSPAAPGSTAANSSSVAPVRAAKGMIVFRLLRYPGAGTAGSAGADSPGPTRVSVTP
jgi:hypothetical protein